MTNVFSSILYISLSSTLMAVSLGSKSLGWVSFISLLPLFYILKKNEKTWFRYGLIFSITFFLVSVFWITHNSGTTPVLAFVSYISTVLFLALRWSVIFAISGYAAKRFGFEKGLLILISMWISWEWVTSLGELGFPWTIGALSLLPLEIYNNFFSITGIWGASLLILLVNYFIFQFFAKNEFRFAFLTIVFLLFPLLLPKTENPFPKKVFQIGVIQQNIDPVGKWADDPMKTMLTAFDLSKSLLSQKPDLIVWPETAIPFHLMARHQYREILQTYIDSLDVSVVSGAQHFIRNDDKVDIYNAVFCIRPTRLGGVDTNFYAKRWLVPGGERMPFQSFLPFMNQLKLGQAEFSIGPSEMPISVPTKKGMIKVGTPVCYESIFPSMAVMFAKNGVQILANVTNDGWYDGSNEKIQHAELFKGRAIEIKVPLVRSANTGISGWVNANGEWVSKLEEMKPIAEVYSIEVPEKPFRTLGSIVWLPILSIGFVLFLFYLGAAKARNSQLNKEN